jgi:hypothetical protein
VLFVLYSTYQYGDKIKEHEMGGACCMHVSAYRILFGNPDKKKQLGRKA